MAATKQLISTVTVEAGGASSIDFTSIPTGFTDLQIVVSPRENTSGQNFVANVIRFNGDSGNNYTRRSLYGSGSSTASQTAASTSSIFVGSDGGALSTANTFSNFVVYIPNYAGSAIKSVSADTVAENNSPFAESFLIAGLWNSTSAITSVSFLSTTGFVQYSTASLYGITKGNGGATVS